MLRVLGIDPGADAFGCIMQPEASLSSGLRWQFLDVPRLDEDSDRPDPVKLRDWIRRFVPDVCYFESVGPMPKQGISTTSKFMRATGYLEATVRCCDVNMVMVTPQKWKAYYEIPKFEARTRAIATRMAKAHSRQLAMQLFPELAPILARVEDHGRAEAALIAFYGVQRVRLSNG